MLRFSEIADIIAKRKESRDKKYWVVQIVEPK